MREMTTAEFAKANLAALEEPVSVRRYTQVVGTFFPKGLEPVIDPPQMTLQEHSLIGDLAAAEKHVREIEDEVKQLKQELAKRPVITTTAMPDSGHETIFLHLPVVPAPRRTDDPFAGLAKQDREFFERKLGKKGSK